MFPDQQSSKPNKNWAKKEHVITLFLTVPSLFSTCFPDTPGTMQKLPFTTSLDTSTASDRHIHSLTIIFYQGLRTFLCSLCLGRMRLIFTEKMHFSSLFLSGLYCFTSWQAVPKYPIWTSVYPSPGTFHYRDILLHHDNERQEKGELWTPTGMEDEGYVPRLSFFKFSLSPKDERVLWCSLFLASEHVMLCDAAPIQLGKNCTQLCLGSLVPGTPTNNGFA